MRMRRRAVLTALVAVATILTALPASAGHDDDPRTENLHPMGHIEEPASLFYGPPTVHTDLAFWGKYAFQGNWLGLNVRDVSAPGNPRPVSFTECEGNQGDVLIWDDVLVRSWNSPAPSPTPDSPGATCDGQLVPAGFEGLHIFDVSNVRNPDLIGSVELECGSHTATAVPDPANDRLLVYNSGSNSACEGIEIVEIPLSDPTSATQINFVELDRDCHDIGVILGDADKAACAGDDGFAVLDLSGSLEDPTHEYSVTVPGVSVGHSAAFSWDGDVVIFGHEPGGGVDSNCEEPNPESDKSYFFYETATGDLLGTWVLPRPQSSLENCTLHNLNVVPTRSGNDVLVHGSYQSGVSVVDFTDPTHPVELAFSDPPPISPPDLGGSWSAYWYNNFIYETNITEGLNIFRFSGKQTAGAMRLDHLNPQTQMFTIDG